MSDLHELDVVRVASLEGVQRESGEVCARDPQVGDLATVISLLHRPGQANAYLCECVAEDGMTLWMATFVRESLALHGAMA